MIKTPTCPDCGQLPAPDLILADGHQAFCQTDGCPVITWDMHLTARENRANATMVDLEGLEGLEE
jgi:hypothetical protein